MEESEFLNPFNPIRTTYLNGYEFFLLLWRSPVRFYYSPLVICNNAVLYIFYLLLVTWVSYSWVYPYSEYHGLLLSLLWICNGGYILYELLEWEAKIIFYMDSIIMYGLYNKCYLD